MNIIMKKKKVHIGKNHESKENVTIQIQIHNEFILENAQTCVESVIRRHHLQFNRADHKIVRK